MSYDLVRFERGQVWYIRGYGTSTPVGHEQSKDRPWLVLSDRKFNSSAGMVTAVPITSRDNITTPAQVMFVNDKSKNNVILCEQIKTFDTACYKFEYLGALSDELMEKVDKALAFHLGLNINSVDLNLLLESVESVVQRIIDAKKADLSPKFSDEDVARFLERLTATTDAALKKATIPEKGSGREYVLQEHDFRQSSKNTPSETGVKSQRIKWTPEIAQKFLKDADEHPMVEVMQRWSILKKPRFYSMRKYAEDLLSKTNTPNR